MKLVDQMSDQTILGRLYYYIIIHILKQSVYCLRMNSHLKYSWNVNKLRFLNKELNYCIKFLLFLDLYNFFSPLQSAFVS